jgi:hypothetical protein
MFDDPTPSFSLFLTTMSIKINAEMWPAIGIFMRKKNLK